MQEKVKEITETDVSNETGRSLIVHNDEIHSFEYVIEKLIEICDHHTEQAVQCTYIIHHKGKCDVKKGSYDELKPLKDKFTSAELGATIE